MFFDTTGSPEINELVFQGNGPNLDEEEILIRGLTALCIVGIEDPVRDEVRSSSAACCQCSNVSDCFT